MNYRYIAEQDSDLAEFIARNPAAGIHEIRDSHPAWRAMSLDRLSLKLAQIERRRRPTSLK